MFGPRVVEQEHEAEQCPFVCFWVDIYVRTSHWCKALVETVFLLLFMPRTSARSS